MKTVDFSLLRKKLDHAITYADFEVARKLANECLITAQNQEDVAEIGYFRAQRAIIEEDFDEAIRCLELALKHNPCDGAAYNDFALCRLELGAGEEEVLANFNKGIEVEPDYASVYHNKGWYLNKLGRTEEAIPYFQKALELEPNRAVTFENLADAYLVLGALPEALKAYRQVLRTLPPDCLHIKEQIEAKISRLLEF